jgi:predicted DNA-binding protein YlxM (UPF0122 family)
MTDRLLEKREEALRLYALYGNLLTPSQKALFADYYAYDLSLSEISANRGISRAAASDSLRKTLAKLRKYESRLHFLAQKDNVAALLLKAERADGAAAKDELLRQIKEALDDGF